jgi:hypothetical protein
MPLCPFYLAEKKISPKILQQNGFINFVANLVSAQILKI